MDFKWNEPKNGYTQDHQLIANYLDLVDSEAQVSIDNFSLNLLYYLSTFYHFLDSKLKMAQGHQSIEPLNQSPSTSRHLAEETSNNVSEYASPLRNQDNVKEGSQSIKSNIRQLMSGKISLYPRATHIRSTYTDNSSFHMFMLL